jgi:two-component system OmpR family response regulator
LCRQLSRRGVAPIIIIGSSEETRNALAVFEAGADDYVSRPFNPREVVARVRAILRRTSSVRHPSDMSRVPTPASLLNHDGFVQV